jgi:4-amino-4-deoxy-L-arabinose transferase-like glycosyltransferase
MNAPSSVLRAVWPIALAAFVLRAFVAWTLPLDASDAVRECAPDERGHLQVIQRLASGRLLTSAPDPRSSYEAFPPVPYVPHAVLLALGDAARIDGLARFPPRSDAGAGMLPARAGSVVLGVLTVVLLALAAHAWTGDVAAARWTALVAALYPQLLFIGGYANADAYTIAAGAFVVLALARWARAGEGAVGLDLLAVGLAFVVLGKPSGYFVLVTTAAWIMSAALGGRLDGRAITRAGAIIATIAGPWLAWNAWRTGGDVLGLRHYAAWLASLRHPFTPGIEIPNAPRLFVEWLSFSSFGVFRNLDVYLPTPFYVVALTLLIGGLLLAASSARTTTTDRRGVAWLVASVAANLALVAYNCWFVGFSPQGRYVLLMVLLVTAIACTAPATNDAFGPRRIWAAVYGAFLALAALWSVAVIHTQACVG